MEKETYKIPSTVMNQLKDNLKKHADDVPKPKGYSMVQGIVSLEYATHNQLAKIDTFTNNYQPSDKEQKEAWEMYGNKLRSFATNTINSESAKKKRQNRTRSFTDHPTGTKHGNRTGGTVDRLNTVNTKSTEPTKVTSSVYDQIMTNEAKAELNRIKQLMYS